MTTATMIITVNGATVTLGSGPALGTFTYDPTTSVALGALDPGVQCFDSFFYEIAGTADTDVHPAPVPVVARTRRSVSSPLCADPMV